MFDVAQIDAMYDAMQGVGAIQWCLFDKKALLPLEQLPAAVKGETGEVISEEELRDRAGQGWFELLVGQGPDGPYEGVPLYIPSRIGLFLKLERDGYTAEELRRIAAHEEWMVDNVLTTDDLEYVEDDVEQLLVFSRERLASLERGIEGGWKPDPGPGELEKARGQIRLLERIKVNGVPDHLRLVIDKHVHRVRAINDLCRIQMLDMDRAQIQAGYSPCVVCGGHSWTPETGWEITGPIWWEPTVRAALAETEGGEAIPIRVGGFILRGERVTTARTLRPAEYAALWNERGIDDYLTTWSRLKGDRRCLNCFAAIPLEADPRKRFCTDRCRNAAKQRRFRRKNPEAVEQAQKRYWESVDLD